MPFVIFNFFNTIYTILLSCVEFNRVLFFHEMYLNYIIIKATLYTFYQFRIIAGIATRIWGYFIVF